jgi:hypothetical protein
LAALTNWGREMGLVRFGVGDERVGWGIVWTLVHSPNRDDVYIMARAIGGIIKASLHASGDWRHGFTAEGASLVGIPNHARALDRWSRNEEFTNGWVRAFSIWVPESEVRGPKETAKAVEWLPPPPAGKVVFNVLLGKSSYQFPTELRAGEAPVTTVYRARLPNQAPLVITAHTESLSSEEAERLSALKIEAAGRLAVSAGTHGIAFGELPDGSRNYIEFYYG